VGPRAPRPLTLSLSAGLLGGVVAAAALALAWPARAEPPSGGLFTPSTSLAGARVGMTTADVVAVWGARHGVCRECPETTWYFNERPFRPEGTGAVFERGRLVHAFTVWQPDGWTTPEGLELGGEGGKIGETYGLLTEHACAGYTALVLEEGAAWSVFYVHEDDVWGFGLTEPRRSPCL
jgi:hypothetical protein